MCHRCTIDKFVLQMLCHCHIRQSNYVLLQVVSVWLFVLFCLGRELLSYYNKHNEMENAEEIFHFLEEFSKRKPKTIPQELNEYLAYVARTGDPVYQWSLVKSLFKEKLLNVITDFYETTPGIEIPPYPNVDPFNYDIMKNSLIERLDAFTSAPFTVQRLCELLTCPRKQYNRVDKFMRAIEKNILVVSTREPGIQRYPEPENGEPNEPVVNGSDNNSEYNVDVEMEDVSWKDNAEQHNSEPQPGSSDSHISVDDIEARLKAKEDVSMDTHEKAITHYESVTPPELNVTTDEVLEKTEEDLEPSPQPTNAVTEDKAVEQNIEPTKSNAVVEETLISESKEDIEMKPELNVTTLVIPEIKVDDTEMTEQNLIQKSTENIEIINDSKFEAIDPVEKHDCQSETKIEMETQPLTTDESSSDSVTKEESESKVMSEVSTSSEESSSSSDNTDGSSNSPKVQEQQIDLIEEMAQPNKKSDNEIKPEEDTHENPIPETIIDSPKTKIESDNYSISDVNSELPQPPPETFRAPKDLPDEISEEKEELNTAINEVEEQKKEIVESLESKEN